MYGQYARTVYYKFLHQHLPTIGDLPPFESHGDLRKGVDFLFSIGGDGTLLDTVCLVRTRNIPIVGINAGRLGFLSSVSRETLPLAIESIPEGHYTLDARTPLRLESNKPIFAGENIGLNEFTLHKKLRP